MPRKPDQLASVAIRFTTTPQVRAHLESLVETGLYGRNAPEAVDRLIGEAIRRLAAEGVLKLGPGKSEER